MVVLTVSYGPDFEVCRDLNRSVLAFTDEAVRHHIVVSRRDLARFSVLAGPRTDVDDLSAFLPRSIVRLPLDRYWINLARPFPPSRGWIVQQLVKLAFTAQSSADVVLHVDSDVTLIRPVTATTFVKNGIVRFYRMPDEIDERLPRHVIWHRVARAMLGLPDANPRFSDYVSAMVAWNPAIVREMGERIAQVRRRPWLTTVGSHLHFSESTLYGVFVDEVVGPAATRFDSADSLCRSYWNHEPLDAEGLTHFLAGVQSHDVAVLISSKSNTPLTLRRSAIGSMFAQTESGR